MSSAERPEKPETPESPEQPPSVNQGQARRLQQGVRDMLLSLLALLVLIGALAWVSRGCSFAPGGPVADPSTAPSRDAGALLRNAAGRVDFPVRAPQVPRHWRANSGDVAGVGGGAGSRLLSRVGWVTGAGSFLELAQSDARPVALAAAETGAADGVAPQGSVTVDGRKWTVYPGRRAEACWVTDLGGVRVLLTGSASPADFRTLASAVLAAKPLPR